jgi:crotonobetainyl-CoA:carnitine CoA-transferase CaiB-like acyl-CoA transferase
LDGQKSEPATVPHPPENNSSAAPWLEGVKILDLCNVLAGPQISSTLVRFGANVTALGPIHSTMDPWNTVIYGLQVNQGKRSVLTNIATPQGREILDRLLQQTDIVTYNGPDRQIQALGLDPERLREINPNLILCKLDCYGGPCPGPRSHHPGYDDTTQASTGVMTRFGGPDTPEEHAHMGTIDVLGGIAGAFGAAVALFQRRRGGTQRFVKTSLAAAGQLLQAPYMYDHEGRAPFDEPSGRDVKGNGAFYHCYGAVDCAIFIAVPPDRIAAVECIPGLEGIALESVKDQKARLFKIIGGAPSTHWQQQFRAAGACAMPLGSLEALRARFSVSVESARPAACTYRFVRHTDHPAGRPVTLVDWAGVRPADTPIVTGHPAPKFGAHTREVLCELGYSTDEVERLFDDGIVCESWSKNYMPT